MRSKQFLMLGGWILIILAVLGFVNFRIGDTLYFDNAENWAHLVIGVVGVAAAYWASAGVQKMLTMLVGLIALYFGIHGFLVAGNAAPNYFGVTNLEIIDDVIHVVVGVWALWASMGDKEMAK